jgi:hypothetical protein
VRCFLEQRVEIGTNIFQKSAVEKGTVKEDGAKAIEKLTGAVEAELCRNMTIYGSCKFEGKGRLVQRYQAGDRLMRPA